MNTQKAAAAKPNTELSSMIPRQSSNSISKEINIKEEVTEGEAAKITTMKTVLKMEEDTRDNIRMAAENLIRKVAEDLA
jgi:hypothetical protein